jgi:hypothetical protein
MIWEGLNQAQAPEKEQTPWNDRTSNEVGVK